jgi:hypothetical protein
MSTKKSIMSLSIDPELQDYIKTCAKEEGVSYSQFVRNLVIKCVVEKDQWVMVKKSDEFTPVVLKIPSELKGVELREWLEVRTNAIVQKLS